MTEATVKVPLALLRRLVFAWNSKSTSGMVAPMREVQLHVERADGDAARASSSTPPAVTSDEAIDDVAMCACCGNACPREELERDGMCDDCRRAGKQVAP